MAIGRKNIYRAKDHDGDEYVAELRQPLPDEWVQYKREMTEIKTENRQIQIEQNYQTKTELFDLLVVDVSGLYENAKGEKVPFGLKTNPIPDEELQRLIKLYNLPKESTLLDLIPYQFKSDAVTVLIDAFEEQVNIAKKNSSIGSRTNSGTLTK